MVGNKFKLSQKKIRELLKPKVEKIKQSLQTTIMEAINDFYDDYLMPPNTYDRVPGFPALADIERHATEKDIENGIRLEITLMADDVAVNPWGGYDGSPEWAFDSGFLHGFHGGPRKTAGGAYSWSGVKTMSPSPWEVIDKAVKDMSD